MAKKELDLFDLTTGLVAQAGTSAAQIVRCKLIHFRPPCSLFDDLPNDFGRHPVTPDSTVAVNPAKDFAVRNSCWTCLIIYDGFGPLWHGHCSDALTFSNKICNDPVIFPHLKALHREFHQFSSPQTTPEKNADHSPIPKLPEIPGSRVRQQRSPLVGS